MQTKRFQRRIEDFTCEHCGAHVVGDGYTDHCPRCLWSKHVDVRPGDRSHACLGMMKPTAVGGNALPYTINYSCAQCGYKYRNKMHVNDNIEHILALAENNAHKSTV